MMPPVPPCPRCGRQMWISDMACMNPQIATWACHCGFWFWPSQLTVEARKAYRHLHNDHGFEQKIYEAMRQDVAAALARGHAVPDELMPLLSDKQRDLVRRTVSGGN